ncbi:conserved exported hypothetical protein [Verrucomicrobia bacterium]|nr:conserved exported hypothetical protein [Verrucomicrobiota bacterium]
MKIQTLKRLLLGALLLARTQGALHAQRYSIGWSVFAGGGGTSSGGQYSVSGTIGQYDAGGPLAGGNYSLDGGFWKSAAGGVVLSISLTGPNTLTISWPVPVLGCFVLQHNAGFNPGSWVDVPGLVTFANGKNQMTWTIAPSQPIGFFRLISPCL